MTTVDWTQWLREHGPAVVLLARQFVINRTDAEDIVQEAFVRFWKSRHRADDAVVYLYACVRNCALEWHRSRKRRINRERIAFDAGRVADDSDFAGPIEQAERRAALENAMRRLPQLQREVLVMKIWGGLSFPQIAETLKIPANTAASRYRYALSRMREQLVTEPIQ